ncbi:R3H domain-containing nucleic acid-binding protein [Auritidibacter sp. NML100628]|uniref:Jag family protein n=1 Tax=Auritidibacter sp. NML100628 TaxID=2170742 RepID=UPI000D729ABA|nr:R3H domain-containing nucleic acid-binding protein [Auritidibacter sp. NML100628]PXA77043.1 RNA-binding protein [Auritidibacter sp. NML100628]PXA81772.1 RNA-binding protein [Auritidibacter sp. NML120779]
MTTTEELQNSVEDHDVSGDASLETTEAQDSVSAMEEEGDRAADYIEELLDIADLDGDIDIEVRNGRTYLSVVTDGDDEQLQGLIGTKGKVLEALQELTRLAVLSSTGQRSRLVLDIAGHRQQREAELRVLAKEAISEISDGDKDEVHLKSMSPYERKIVHDVVAEAGLFSESQGQGSRRHVVISADN